MLSKTCQYALKHIIYLASLDNDYIIARLGKLTAAIDFPIGLVANILEKSKSYTMRIASHLQDFRQN